MVSPSPGTGNQASTRLLKDVVEKGRKEVLRDFNGNVAEEKRSALRKLYDDHHDESVIFVIGEYDKKRKQDWIQVTQVPQASNPTNQALSGKKNSGFMEIQSVDVKRARKDSGSRAGEMLASPPVFVQSGGKRALGGSAEIHSSMKSGEVEVDQDDRVMPVNKTLHTRKIDQVSGDE